MSKVGDIFVDYQGERLFYVEVNGVKLSGQETWHDLFKNDKINIQAKYLKDGPNVIEIKFESAYRRDCTGICHFKDTED